MGLNFKSYIWARTQAGLTQVQSDLPEERDVVHRVGERSGARGLLLVQIQVILGLAQCGDGGQDAVLADPQVHQGPTHLWQAHLSI